MTPKKNQCHSRSYNMHNVKSSSKMNHPNIVLKKLAYKISFSMSWIILAMKTEPWEVISNSFYISRIQKILVNYITLITVFPHYSSLNFHTS